MKNFGEKKKIDYEFSQMMQDASLLYQEQCLKENEIDKAFISAQIKARKKQKVKRLLTSAAAVVLILVTGITVNVWLQTDGVYGGKQFIKKCVTLISPLDYEEEINEDGNVSTTVSITNEEHLDAAKEYFEPLRIPKYIPDGYVFQQLTIREDSTMTTVEYIYNNGDTPLLIAFMYSEIDEEEEIVVTGDVYQSPVSGKKLYVSENPSTQEYSVIEITKTYECVVSGIGELEEGIRIMESIEKL